MKSEGKTGFVLLALWLFMVLCLWGAAFFPTTVFSDAWVRAAQAACFGTLEDGLPARQGWILLVISPLFILSILWASHGDELRGAFSYLRSSRAARWMALPLIGFLMLDAHWVGVTVTNAARLRAANLPPKTITRLPADYPRGKKPAPAFNLINQLGERMDHRSFQNKVTILTFAFAHCSSICPFIIKDALSAQQEVNSPDLQTIIISIDPWRDTPATLPAMAQSWSLNHNAFLLTETPDVITKTLERYQIKTARDQKNGQINHAGQTMLVDRNGDIAYSFLNPTTEWITTAARRLLNE